MTDKWARCVRGFLVVTDVLMVIGAFVALMVAPLPDKNRDIILVVIGALLARSEKIAAFFFGSSKGSEDKTELLMAAPPPLELTDNQRIEP